MRRKRWLAAVMSAVLLVGTVPAQLYAGETAAVVQAAESETGQTASVLPQETQIKEEKKTETPKETEAAAETETQKATETAAETETQKATETAAETETQKATETAAETETQKETETAAETETQKETETAAETEIQTETESETEYVSSLMQESETESETECENKARNSSVSYLQYLEVYRDALGTKGTCELVRHEELDETYGGIVYMTDFGSTANSASFFVAAALSEEAPLGQDTPITLSAYDLNGTLQSVAMKPSTEQTKRRFRILNAEIFSSGANGGKRAIYTITVGTQEDQQIYKIIVNRTLELKGLSCYAADPLESILNESFSMEQKSYTATVAADTASVSLNVQLQNQAVHTLSINGQPYESSTVCNIPLTEVLTTIPISLREAGTYAGAEYEGLTYESAGDYQVTVRKTMTAGVTFLTQPEDAVVCLYDNMGSRIYPSTDNDHYFTELLCGNTYTYQISSYGYQAQRHEFVLTEETEIEAALDSIDSKQEELTGNEWWNYRNNEENNGITNVSTPEKIEETTLKWGIKLGNDWNAASTPPLLLGGQLYTAAGKYIYRMDKSTGEVLAVSEELKGSMSFALNPLTYAEGMIFAQIGNGQIQALNAKTLKSLWVSEPVGGQTLSPITYKNGYIYTGTWNSETAAGSYFCLSVTDEDPSREDEIKYCTWKYSHRGGFYWAGSYTNGTYIVFGSDDGNNEGNYTETSILYSVQARTGILLDKIEGLHGDIRTSIVYENGYAYFATKGGYLYRVAMNADGTFGQLCEYNLGGMATASPVVYKGRIYIGVCGTGGQFNADGGHHFAVLTENADGLSLAYKMPVGGYPQAGALLSTAYEQIDYDGDGQADGRVYLYFTFNAFPGGIYYFTDQPGQTSGTSELLFVPEAEQQQYCISPICVDSDGTLYYKNDSCYIMAVEANGAYLEGIQAEASVGAVKWNNEFKKSRSNYELLVDPSATEAAVTLTVPEGRSVTVNGEPYQGIYHARLGEDGTCKVRIQVGYQNKKRIYTLEIARVQSDAALKTLIISDSNQITDLAARLPLSPEYSLQQTSYTAAEYTGKRAFLNVYAQASGSGASMEMSILSGAKKVNRYTASNGNETYIRYAVYFADGESRAVVNLKVTAADKITVQNYQITLLREDVYPPLLTGETVIRQNMQEAQIRFASNESGSLWYQIVKSGAAEPQIDTAQPGQKLISGENRIQIDGLQGGGADVYILTADEKGNRPDRLWKVSIEPYQLHSIRIKGLPAGAICVITDATGQAVSETDGVYQLVNGNTYQLYAVCKNYEELQQTFTVRADTDEYTFEMVSLLSQNADLAELYVSSSAKYGSGLLKLTPEYAAETTRYEAVYTKERTHLNLWAEAAEEKAAVSVYAVGGVSAATISKDETIAPKQSADGHAYWEVYFEKGTTTAQVRVNVRAEDGTQKNYFVKLSIVDVTAPVLRKVSASRIAVDRASVVFQTNENGTYYYAVTEKGAKAPKISRDNGTEVLEGTVTISLFNLKKGEKEVYVIVRDAAGNESKTLVIAVPDSRTGSYVGSAVSGTGGGGQLAGQLSSSLRPGGTSADGSKNNLKVSTTIKKTYTVVKKPVSGADAGGYVVRDGVRYKFAVSETGETELIPETAFETEMQLEEKLSTLETAVEEAISKSEQAAAEHTQIRRSGFSRWKIQGLDLSVRRNQILLLLAGIGLAYLLFVTGAVTVNRRRRR